MLKKIMIGLMASALVFTPAVAQNRSTPVTIYDKTVGTFNVKGYMGIDDNRVSCVIEQKYDDGHNGGYIFWLTLDIAGQGLYMRIFNSEFQFKDKEVNTSQEIEVVFFKNKKPAASFKGGVNILATQGIEVPGITPSFMEAFRNADLMQITFKETGNILTYTLKGTAKATDTLLECGHYVHGVVKQLSTTPKAPKNNNSVPAKKKPQVDA